MYAQALNAVLERLAATARDAGRPVPRLLAVSKTQPATAVAEMAAALRSAAAHELNVTGVAHAPAFGENYVQEALAKQVALTSETLEWHLIGHLQSNKAREARSEEHTSELQSLMRTSYSVFCLKKKNNTMNFNTGRNE